MEAVPDEAMRTVVFLCVDEQGEGGTRRVPKATGLFVRVPVEDSPSHAVDYIVTARHCIDSARPFKNLYIRLNRKNDSFIEVPTKIEDWYLHDNADVAAICILRPGLPEGVKYTDLDCASVSINSFVGGAPNYEVNLGDEYDGKIIQPRVGHQVYLTGLFTEHHGEKRNLPIARFGHISRMPDLLHVKINEIDTDLVAYLIEFHSIGGHSGSPVFFLVPMVVEDRRTWHLPDGQQMRVIESTDIVWHTGFMGLVSGHYDIEQEAKKIGDILGKIQIGLNSGIAFVTPAEAITQLLTRNDMKEFRRKLKAKRDSEQPAPTLDMIDKNGISKEQFHAILDMASKPTTKSDSEQS